MWPFDGENSCVDAPLAPLCDCSAYTRLLPEAIQSYANFCIQADPTRFIATVQSWLAARTNILTNSSDIEVMYASLKANDLSLISTLKGLLTGNARIQYWGERAYLIQVCQDKEDECLDQCADGDTACQNACSSSASACIAAVPPVPLGNQNCPSSFDAVGAAMCQSIRAAEAAACQTGEDCNDADPYLCGMVANANYEECLNDVARNRYIEVNNCYGTLSPGLAKCLAPLVFDNISDCRAPSVRAVDLLTFDSFKCSDAHCNAESVCESEYSACKDAFLAANLACDEAQSASIQLCRDQRDDAEKACEDAHAACWKVCAEIEDDEVRARCQENCDEINGGCFESAQQVFNGCRCAATNTFVGCANAINPKLCGCDANRFACLNSASDNYSSCTENLQEPDWLSLVDAYSACIAENTSIENDCFGKNCTGASPNQVGKQKYNCDAPIWRDPFLSWYLAPTTPNIGECDYDSPAKRYACQAAIKQKMHNSVRTTLHEAAECSAGIDSAPANANKLMIHPERAACDNGCLSQYIDNFIDESMKFWPAISSRNASEAYKTFLNCTDSCCTTHVLPSNSTSSCIKTCNLDYLDCAAAPAQANCELTCLTSYRQNVQQCESRNYDRVNPCVEERTRCFNRETSDCQLDCLRANCEAESYFVATNPDGSCSLKTSSAPPGSYAACLATCPTCNDLYDDCLGSFVEEDCSGFNEIYETCLEGCGDVSPDCASIRGSCINSCLDNDDFNGCHPCALQTSSLTFMNNVGRLPISLNAASSHMPHRVNTLQFTTWPVFTENHTFFFSPYDDLITLTFFDKLSM